MGDETRLEPGVQRDLAALERLYGNVYTFTVHRGGRWRATRTGTGERLEAPTARQLREKVREDLGRKPVPR